MVTVRFTYFDTSVKLGRQCKTVEREDRANAHAFVKKLLSRARKSETVALISIDVIDGDKLIASWTAKKQWVTK